MAQKNTTLTINGKVYDAVTGLPVGQAPAAVSTPQPAATITPSSSDNGAFSVPVRTAVPIKPETLPHPTIAAQGLHHKTDATKTLMRSSVKRLPPLIHEKPASATLRIAGVSTQAEAGQPLPQHKDRLKRAQEVPRSELVSRFSDQADITISKRVEPLAVATPPAMVAAPASAPSPTVAPTAAESLFDAALAKATPQPSVISSRLKPRQKVAQKLGVSSLALNASVLALLLLAVGGFYSYQNMPRFSMHLVSNEAGIHATLPSYHPTGFALDGPIHYSSGLVSLTYHASSDSRAFTITQTSNTLSNAQLASLQAASQTYQQDGTTIYVSGNSTATWINHGILYQISGNSDLNSAQILQIARSF